MSGGIGAGDVVAIVGVIGVAATVGRFSGSLVHGHHIRERAAEAELKIEEERQARIETVLLGKAADEWGPGSKGMIEQMAANTAATAELAEAMTRLRSAFGKHTDHPPGES